MDVVLSFIPPVLVGVCIGVFSGMLGLGGGTVMVPVFRLAFGLSPLAATATSLATIMPTSISGAISHVRNKTACIPLGLALGLGGACTSPLGVWLSTVSPPWMVMVTAALVIGYSAANMLSKAIKMNPSFENGHPAETGTGCGGHDPAAQGASHPKRAAASGEPSQKALTRKQLAIGVLIGVLAGVASGYIGVGGGFLMIPLMISTIGITMKQASGTSLAAMIILVIPGVVEQGLLGNIDYVIGIATAVGSIPGAVIGAQFSRKVPERALRFMFGGFLIVAAFMLALNELHVLG